MALHSLTRSLLLLSLGAQAFARNPLHQRDGEFTFTRVAASSSLRNRSPQEDVVVSSDRAVPLTRAKSTPNKKALRQALRNGPNSDGRFSTSSDSGTVALAGIDNDNDYGINVTVGGEPFALILDTGSSDTWLISKGFTCYTHDGVEQDESACKMGPAFDTSTSPTWKDFPGYNFNITYSGGDFLTGTFGNDTISVANITVQGQLLALVTDIATDGDGVTSGLLGLAYPLDTELYNTTNPHNDSWDNEVLYDPFIFGAVEQGQTPPYFGISLDRPSDAGKNGSSWDDPLGYIAFGGLPPVETMGDTGTAPVDVYTITWAHGSYTGDVLYLINVTYKAGNETLASTAYVDTGTTYNFPPNSIAQSFNALWTPPATYNDTYGAYVVPCNATAAAMSVVVGGVEFEIDPSGQLYPDEGLGNDEWGTPLCVSGTQPGGADDDGPWFVLGQVFLQNVVSVFDVGKNEVRFTQRAPY